MVKMWAVDPYPDNRDAVYPVWVKDVHEPTGTDRFATIEYCPNEGGKDMRVGVKMVFTRRDSAYDFAAMLIDKIIIDYEIDYKKLRQHFATAGNQAEKCLDRIFHLSQIKTFFQEESMKETPCD